MLTFDLTHFFNKILRKILCSIHYDKPDIRQISSLFKMLSAAGQILKCVRSIIIKRVFSAWFLDDLNPKKQMWKETWLFILFHVPKLKLKIFFLYQSFRLFTSIYNYVTKMKATYKSYRAQFLYITVSDRACLMSDITSL